MPAPLPFTPLKSRLLGGASLSAMVLAVSFAVITPALAQEIDGVTGNATDLSGGNAITSGATGGQFGSIDTDGGANNPASITLTQSETIRVFDSDTGGQASTVTGDFVINTGVTGTIIFAEGDDGGDSNDADLIITGDLEGAADGRGGTLNLSVREGIAQDDSDFTVNGSTNLSAITITAGNATVLANGGDLAAQFGNNDDTFNTTGLTVNGGRSGDMQEGGDASVAINSGSGAGIVTIGADGITVTGGAVGNPVSGSHGGAATLEIWGSVTVGGNVTVSGGDEGGPNLIRGGDATLSFLDVGGTLTINGTLTIATGSDTAGIAGAAGNATVAIGGIGSNITGGVVLSEQQDATATLIVGSDDPAIFRGVITAQNDGDGQVIVRSTDDNRFMDSIGSMTARVGTLLLERGVNAEFDGDLFVGTLTVEGRPTLVQFDGNVDATGIVINGHTVNRVRDFNGMLTIGANNFSLDADGGAQVLVTLSGDVGGTGSIILEDGSTTPGDAELNFDGTTAFSVANTIRGDDDNDGELIISNTAGVTFNGRLGTLTTQGDRAFRQMSVAANGVAIFNNDVATQNFIVLGNGTTLTFNGMGAGPQFLVGNGGGGAMALDDGTIILGSNIDNGDVIFDVTAGNNDDTAFVVDVTPTINVQVGINVLAGDVVTLVDGDIADTVSVAEFNAFNVTDNAFTDFTLARTADGGTANANLVITAVARTDAQAAATLGVSTDQANLLRQAAGSGDTTLVDLLTTAINAGTAQTTLAAQRVGVQSEQAGGGAVVTREMAGQQQGVTGDRLGGFRADDPAFAFNSNGETGFAGGDLDAPYTPVSARYANSVWGQVYGGSAFADGTTALAGFDAGFGGAMIGIDGAWNDNWVVGAFAGYGFADVDGEGAGNAQLETNAYQAGVYAGYTDASFYVDAFAAYAMTQNDTTRTTLGNNTVTGSFDASQITVGLAGGAPIAISPNAYLTPNASLTWNHYDADGYTEVGVGANTVAGFTANTLTGTIGTRLHAVYEMSDGSAIIPELSAGLLYDIIDDNGRASATFVGGGAAYTISGTEIADIGAAIGAGLTMRNDTWSVGLSYDGDIRSDFMSHTARAEVRIRF